MTATERREKARLRSERARRARGVMPRRKAQRPWLAVSRSTYYRRRKQAREREAAAINAAANQAAFERAEGFAVALRRDLDRCAGMERETAAIIAELAALSATAGCQAML
jgi:hypothetical protein